MIAEFNVSEEIRFVSDIKFVNSKEVLNIICDLLYMFGKKQ